MLNQPMGHGRLTDDASEDLRHWVGNLISLGVEVEKGKRTTLLYSWAAWLDGAHLACDLHELDGFIDHKSQVIDPSEEGQLKRLGGGLGVSENEVCNYK